MENKIDDSTMIPLHQAIEFAIHCVEDALGEKEPGIYHYSLWVEEFEKFKEMNYGK